MTLGDDDLVRALPGGDQLDHLIRSQKAGGESVGVCGTGLILDEVFLDGGASQKRLAKALAGLPVMWVAVHCDSEVAAGRERDRPDRIVGMARLQAERVHHEVVYDLVVDTSSASAAACASLISSHLAAVEN
jgi:chloramphenicol 3-O phosphotransferase